jgi:hypothetical protein
MLISTNTNALIAAVQEFSGNQLKHPEDCALLAEAAALASMDAELGELCFAAKFLHKTFTIMKRIGPLADGYEQLSAEFESNIAKAAELMRRLAAAVPEEDRARFTQAYLSMSGAAFASMMEFVHDLNWMKNYSLDQKAQA